MTMYSRQRLLLIIIKNGL